MDALENFSPLTQTWFRERFGKPTPPQAQGWLPIQRGENTLILAPTGSGKTLAAFLWSIDTLFQADKGQPTTDDDRPPKKKQGRPPSAVPGPSEGIRLVYISPLKALNNDVERNLRVPLEGIREFATREKIHLPHVRVAVRTGDTPAKVRADMLKHPPHILITTPESLYLMLTSPRARELFRTTRTVILDEIHTLAGNKRGVHLTLSLERLQRVSRHPIQRIGLSATIKPLEEVARFLGGQDTTTDGERATTDGGRQTATNSGRLPPAVRRPEFPSRPVTIVDARYKKALDLQVVTVVDDFRQLGGTDSIWPYVVPNVLNDIRTHDTTLVFTNSRRLAERTADRLNAQLEAEQSEEIPPGSPEALAPGAKMRDRGIFAIGAQGPIRAHHGSMSKEARHEMEEALKAGKLPALVGTSSLELGIDIGSIDLVVQLQSPKSVAQGLQRVGRSGHLVGQTSRGKIYATFREDLAEAAAIVRGMLEGDVEPTHTPQNALDVLAQQIVASVALEDWDADELYDMVRGAYPYHALTRAAYESVLDMLTGKYFLESPGARAVSALRPKIAWDRVHNRLSALPGSRLLAISNVGTIPDTGQYKVYLADNKTRIGELDEEFVSETRVGDNFLLGSQVWRALEIKEDRVIVADAAGSTPRMPFWNGDAPWRPYELGERIGKFRRDIDEMVKTFEVSETSKVLQRDYALDTKSANNLIDYVESQIKSIGAISSDKTIIVESFQNAVGDPHLVIHSPFGGRVNGAWAVALTSAMREVTGVTPEVMTNDDGIIFRFPQLESDAPLTVITRMTAQEARERILRELPDSAAFGAQFRMNAGRALLLTKPHAGKRTPFWLQRLKAKDLLAYVKAYPDFPILIETYRDVLSDVFDLPHLELILNRITSGEIRVITHESVVPSPVASALMFNLVSTYLYEWDAPKAERSLQMLSVPRHALQEVMQGVEWSELLKPDAVTQVIARTQHTAPGYQARSKEELAIYLREAGDLNHDELLARSLEEGNAWIQELAAEKRIVRVGIATAQGTETRWISVELADEYKNLERDTDILKRFLNLSAPVTRDEILRRYMFAGEWLDETLARLVRTGDLVQGHFTPATDGSDRDEYIDAHLLEQIHRRTLSLLRGQVQPVSIYAYADFLARWQHAHPATRLRDEDATEKVLKQLRGLALAGAVWEREILSARVAEYSSQDLDELTENGAWVWAAEGNDPKRMRVQFFARGEGALFLSIAPEAQADTSAPAKTVYEFLKSEGASFATDLQTGTRLKGEELASALVELALRGLVTNDEIETLRNLVEFGGVVRSGKIQELAPHKPLSALEQELGERLGPRPLKRTQYREAKRRTMEKIQRSIAQQVSPWRGRWTLTQRAGILGAPQSDAERAEKWARLLLQRYGVVTRDVLEREEVPNLDMVYAEWQRMEWRGQARRGIFVAGRSGIQYALPNAVEQLRVTVRNKGGQWTTDAEQQANDETSAPYVLNAVDPANLFGGENSDETGGVGKFARVPSTSIACVEGEPILLAQENGERLTVAPNASAEIVTGALREFFTRANAPRHAIVAEWNGDAVLGSAGEALLKGLGFYRIPKGMELWRK